MRLVTVLGVRKQTQKHAQAPEHFKRHGRVVLDAATDELMTNTKTTLMLRLPTIDGVLCKSVLRKAKSSGPTRTAIVTIRTARARVVTSILRALATTSSTRAVRGW